MVDEFIIRVDEELPSDERVAVKLLETKVLSDEYRGKLEMLIEKIEKFSFTANVDILTEIKNILEDMLDAIGTAGKKHETLERKHDILSGISENCAENVEILQASVREKYDMMSEILLKIGENLGDLKVGNSRMLEEWTESLNEKIGQISSDLERLNDKIIGLSESLVKLDEKVNGLSSGIINSLARIDEKTTSILIETTERMSKIEESMGQMEEKIGDMSVVNAETLEKLDNSGTMGAFRKLEERIGEISVMNAEILERLDLTDMNVVGKQILAKVDEMNNVNAVTGDILAEMNDKVSSREMPDTDEMKRKINTANSELARLSERLEDVMGKSSELIIGIERFRSTITSRLDAIDAKLVPKPKPKHARRARVRRKTRKVRRPAVRRISDENLDVIIVNQLRSASMNIRTLRKACGVSEKRLRERLDVLLARGVVIRERRGRYIFYSARIEEVQ